VWFNAGHGDPGFTITGGSVPACSQVPCFQVTVTAVTTNIFVYFIEPATDHADPHEKGRARPRVVFGRARRGQPSTRLGLDSHTVARTSWGVKTDK